MKEIKLILSAFVGLMLDSAVAWSNLSRDGVEVILTYEKCQELLIHGVADEDIAYKPDVDEDGQALVPVNADAMPQIVLPKEIKVPIHVNFMKDLTRSAADIAEDFESDEDSFVRPAEIGVVKMLDDGRVYFNNQPLEPEDQTHIMEACKKLLKHPS